LALEAWEIILVVVIIILLLKPEIVTKAARSIGKAVGEYRKGKTTGSNLF
jgi:Sec-independent protein translocase protein TatA